MVNGHRSGMSAGRLTLSMNIGGLRDMRGGTPKLLASGGRTGGR